MQQFGGVSFNCGPRYHIQKLVGAGAYGNVCLAVDLEAGKQKVALKKLNKIEDDIDAKRILREIRIQRIMKHPNILQLKNIVYDQTSRQILGDIYLVVPYYPSDLYKIIKSKQELSIEHVQFIMYQLCKGLNYLHSAGTLHRDIKPGNILANENCEVCYCDFGFARTESAETADAMTEYVVTRYYRAPEIMLSSQQYSKPVDIWALGCTFAELITGQILFKGQNYIQMIKMIFDALGKPDEKELAEFINNENAKSFVDTLPAKPKQKISKVINYQSGSALDLLDRMLELNPSRRITAEQCLEHPFFAQIRALGQEIKFEGNFACDFENDDVTLDQLREMILKEINEISAENSGVQIDVKGEMKRLNDVQKQLEEERKKNFKKK